MAMSGPEGAITERNGGVIISIEVSPGSDRDAFPDGYNIWRNAVGCRTKARPREGEANKAVIHIISERLHVPQASVTLMSGAVSTQKKVFIADISRNEVLKRLFPCD
jgi:uncharacterized protein (TIGR00251 family)